MATSKAPTLVSLAKLHHVAESILSRWQKQGIDIYDSRAVCLKVWNARKTAPEWSETIDAMRSDLDEGSERYWRREKLKRETEKLQLHNDLASGEQYKRADVDAANLALGSAFKLALSESESVLPPQLVGLSEAEIEKVLRDMNRKLLTDLSDMQSGLWQGILAKYRETSRPDEGSESNDKPKPARKMAKRVKLDDNFRIAT